MSQSNEEDLRRRLDDSDDPDLLEQRRRLEQGEPQPVPELVDEIVVLTESVTVEQGKEATAPVDEPLDRLVAQYSASTRMMLVIRQRTLTDNTFSVSISLTPSRSDGSGQDAEELAVLWFFDHLEHEGHHEDMLVTSDEPLGFWFIDVGEQVSRFARRGLAPGDVTLRLTVDPVDPESSGTMPFTVGGISLGVFTGVGATDADRPA